MNKKAAHTQSWQTFEAVFGTALGLSLILGFLIPLPLSLILPRAASISIGIIFFIAGLYVVVITRRLFIQASQPTDPGRPTTRLITTGIFSWSRNPLYLGGVVTYISLGMLLNSLWSLILLIPAVIAAHFILIFPEERYLEIQFGEEYQHYARAVRRWFGRRR